MVAAREAHLLICRSPRRTSAAGAAASALRRRSQPRAHRSAPGNLFLEVRPSNLARQALYTRFGFRRIGVRRGYYLAPSGREDALVLTLSLQ